MEALYELKILDTPKESRFDEITKEAAEAFEVPIAVVSLVDKERQWFKSIHGLDAEQTSRDSSFCAHTILDEHVFIVQDTLLDDRFAENMLVTGGPRIRFYAGCPLNTPDGYKLGALCLIDSKPRYFGRLEVIKLKEFASQVEAELLQTH